MNYIELPKEAVFTPIYSPRTALSRLNAETERLTTNLAINIDKYILGFFKDAFEAAGGQLGQEEFMVQGLKHLRSWQRELQYRQEKLYECLARLFRQADSNRKGSITWSQFNSMLIEKGLNLKSLRNQQPASTALMKPVPHAHFQLKHAVPIQKMLSLDNKIALFVEQSNQIDFFNLDGSTANMKPLILNQQALTVQTSMLRRGKEGKEVVKKELVVAEYKNVLLDMIYINDSKYNMLITSSTDFVIRGWDVSSNLSVLARQPQNEDEKMQHQFPVEIHTMAWDNVNEILYCCGKTPTIYQWMVKTDSQRQLSDPDAHTQMISAMIMMPKLQFLATGGYDGKLILWDTISQTKKFKYKEHTRSISSMAFHEGLILLFTAAYDHSVCVWNPYIQSLVHKIICNINVLQLGLISETNLLITLDAEANVKVRQISKFSLVSAFSIDRHDQKNEPTCMISTNNPLRYYFAGNSISVFEYVHVDANVIVDSTVLCLKYLAQTFSLFCPVKNHLVTWDLLTGNISNTLRNQTVAQITAFDIFQDLKIGVFGDAQGNIILRKLQNGVLVKKLHKHRLSVSIVLAESSGSDRLIFTASYDGQISVFQRDQGGDFNLVRSVSAKKLSVGATVTSLGYQSKRNTLMIGTQTGQIYFLDIDKNKLVSRCQTRAGDVEQLVQLEDDTILLAFSKKAEIFGLYLPPHPKKFRPACHLVSEQAAKISSVAMSKGSKRCYIGFQNGDLLAFYLPSEVLSDPRQDQPTAAPIRHLWKHSFAQPIRSLILIEKQQVMIALVGQGSISLLACDSGFQLAQLSQKQMAEPNPILFLDEESSSIFVKEENLNIPLKVSSKQDQIKRVFDPAFYLKIVESYQTKINPISNLAWKFTPRIQEQVSRKVAANLALYERIRNYQLQPKKLQLVRAQSQPSFDIHRAVQIQKKWQKQKEEEQGRSSKLQSLHNSHSQMRISRYGSLNKAAQNHIPLSNSQMLPHQSSPMLRLAAALQNINQKDAKAGQLRILAEKELLKTKNKLKLPKLGVKETI